MKEQYSGQYVVDKEGLLILIFRPDNILSFPNKTVMFILPFVKIQNCQIGPKAIWSVI